MRDIKFRAVRFFKDGTCDMDYSKHWKSLGEFISFLEVNYRNNHKLLAYTGLKDKNGTEIYKSDVVYVTPLLVENNPSFRAIVEWGVSEFVIRRISNFTDGFYMYPVIMDLNPMAFSFEVIGNIYEHPHLLGGEEQ